MRNSNLTGCDLTNANLTGTLLDGAKCESAKVGDSFVDFSWLESATLRSGIVLVDSDSANVNGEETSSWIEHYIGKRDINSLTPVILQQLISQFELKQYLEGDIVQKEGAGFEHYFVINTGRYEMFRTLPNGNEIRIETLEVGDSFGEELLASDRASCSTRMMADGSLMFISSDKFRTLLANSMIEKITPREATTMFRDGARFIDVRDEHECITSPIEGSENLPLNLLRRRRMKLSKNSRYILACDDGRRSQAAAFLLREIGLEAYCIAGGSTRPNE